MVHKTHNVVIVPNKDGKYEIQVDGKVDTQKERSDDWMYYNTVRDSRFMVIMGRYMGFQIYYDGQHVHVEVPKIDLQLHGQCAQQM